jgi:cytoskeletal protein RodZ
MALSGELSDLSLAELIEFFCNQRKTGRLKVIFPHLPGYFYIQAGALVDAQVGSLNGIDAVYYALTLPNASFKFDSEHDVEQRTIHQPWTQVVLEGLRRMDEGIAPEPPINKDELPDENDLEQAFESVISEGDRESSALPMALTIDSVSRGGKKRKMLLVAVVAAVLIGVTATLVFANGLAQAESTASIPPVALGDIVGNDQSATVAADPSAPRLAETGVSEQGASGAQAADASALLLKREREARERERRRAEGMADSWPAKTEPAAAAPSTEPVATTNAVKKPDAPKAGPKTVTVQVTYDEAGRVTQASGSDPTALRIARQKRFPSGKPGSTTVTIPIN